MQQEYQELMVNKIKRDERVNELTDQIVVMLNILNSVVAKNYNTDFLDEMYESMYKSQTNGLHHLSKNEIKQMMENGFKKCLVDEINKYDK